MPAITMRELLGAFIRIGLMSFGGPAGQIAVMHRILVEEKRWISEHRFLHALNYCTLLPGPEAQQLCTYCGWLLRGTMGGVIAGALFVIPGVIALLACSLVYVLGAGLSWVDAIFYGIKPAVVALVVSALLRVSKKALRSPQALCVAIASFIALRFFHVPFPYVIATAGLLGWAAGTWQPSWFPVGQHGKASVEYETVIPESALTTAPTTFRRFALVSLSWTALWLLPIAGLTWWLGWNDVFAQVGWFFSKVAVVSFGGAYALLPYISEHAVHDQGWLSGPQMVDGLGLAESTPGPLIMVVQFVAFLAGYQTPIEQLRTTPIMAGLCASAIAVWATFIPSYLWIFAGAPFAERLRTIPAIASALSAITAAVVGVIANLALWFAATVIFGPISSQAHGIIHLPVINWSHTDWLALGLTIVASIAVLRFKLSLVWLLTGSIILGGGCFLLR